MTAYMAGTSNTNQITNAMFSILGLSDPSKRKNVTLTDAIRKFAYVPKNIEKERVKELRVKLLRLTPKTIDEVFPFRNPTDKTLIRYGLKDYANDHLSWKQDLKPFVGLDNVTATNLVLMGKYVDRRYEWLIPRLNANYGVDVFIDVAKGVSNYFKSNTVDLTLRRNFCEMHTLAGFRTLPFGGFDIVKETDKLATGGKVRNFLGTNYVEAIKQVMPILIETIPADKKRLTEKLGFRDYIGAGTWITAGASSIGKVYWEIGDEKGTIKARKNNVPYLYTAAELEEIIMSQLGKQVNVAITKEETAKIRVAVAGDFPNYIAMAWLFYLVDQDWKNFPNIDSGLTDRVETNQTERDDLNLHPFTLPFDFSEFDRQISTDEILAIYSSYVGRAIIMLH